jgi:hypothetical protein
MPFETFGFATNYTVELNPEQPGVGWGDRKRVKVRAGANETVIAEVIPDDGAPWLAIDGAFIGTAPWACATPNPNVVCFVAGWSEFGSRLIDVNSRELVLGVDSYMPRARGIPDLNLLLLVSFTDIVAIGPDGVAWESASLALDDLVVVSASADGILCEGYFGYEPIARFTIDPATGKHLDGPEFALAYGPLRFVDLARSTFAAVFRRNDK